MCPRLHSILIENLKMYLKMHGDHSKRHEVSPQRSFLRLEIHPIKVINCYRNCTPQGKKGSNLNPNTKK